MSATKQDRACPECGLPLREQGGKLTCPSCSLRLALFGERDSAAEGGKSSPDGAKSRYFGEYELLEEIARGGMGVVYRARQLGINRTVALKMVQSHHLLSDEARLRFRVEIEAVAQLHHPNIVPLYESGEHDGAHYFTMKLLSRGDLASALKREAPVRERVQLLVEVCHAVHYAHQRGILHRDLKPSNILLDDEGRPHVADFGLAKSLDYDTGFTFTSTVLGSPNYMAPEQASGNARQLTTAVDVYGLGAILYHILAGRPPFQADTPLETLRQVIDHDPVPPHTFQRHIDRDLETIALKCLRKEPSRRYGTALDLARDLERWLEGLPIQARPISWGAVAWRWSRRHPGAALLGAGLLLAIAAIIVSTAVAGLRIQEADRKATQQLARALVSEARALRIRGEWNQRERAASLLREAAPLDDSPKFRRDARNEFLALLTIPDLPFMPVLQSVGLTNVEQFQIDPRLDVGATVSNQTNILLRFLTDPSRTNRIYRFSSTAGPVTLVDSFSPDRLFVALRHPDAVTIWELSSSRLCWRQPGTNVVFSFSGRGDVAFQESPNEAVIRRLPGGDEQFRWRLPETRPGGRRNGWHTLALSPNGRMLAGASAVSQIVELLDAQTGETLRLLTNSPRATAMSWSPDGNRFAVATGQGRLYVWNTASGALLWTSQSLPGRAHSLAFHPKNTFLAAACEDQHVRVFDLTDFRIVFETAAESRSLYFSPDGRFLGPVLNHQTLGLYEISPALEYSEFDARIPSGRYSDCRFGWDGTFFVVGRPESSVLCDATTPKYRQLLREWSISTVVLDPLGEFVLTANARGILQFPRRTSLAETFAGTNSSVLQTGSGWRALDMSANGQWLAAFSGPSNLVYVFNRTLTNVTTSFGPHKEAEDIAISNNGRWVGTGSYADQSVRIWNVAEQNLELAIKVGPRPQAAFSADDKWVAIFGDKFELRRQGSWELARPLIFPESQPVLGAAAFSLDSRFLAVVGNLNSVHLFDLETFESVAIFRASNAIRLRALAFSPDQTKLAAFGIEGRVAIWDLKGIRGRLAQLSLDWR